MTAHEGAVARPARLETPRLVPVVEAHRLSRVERLKGNVVRWLRRWRKISSDRSYLSRSRQVEHCRSVRVTDRYAEPHRGLQAGGRSASLLVLAADGIKASGKCEFNH